MYLGREWVAAGILVVLIAAGLGRADFTRGYIAPVLAISWGLSWLAVARTKGDFESSNIVWGAANAAALVLLGTVVIRGLSQRHTNSNWIGRDALLPGELRLRRQDLSLPAVTPGAND